MIRTAALCLLLLAVTACAAPTPRVPRPDGDPFAGLAPPPPPAPATLPFRGPLGPVERGDPPVVIVPLAPEERETPRIGEFPALGGGENVYGLGAPYDGGYGSTRRR